MSKSTRVGLSEHTARRLAELRARRAEADDTGGFLTSSTSVHQVTTSVENGSCNHENALHTNSVAEIALSAVNTNSTDIEVLDANSNTARLQTMQYTAQPVSETARSEQLKSVSSSSLSHDSDASSIGASLQSNSLASHASRPSTGSSIHSLNSDISVTEVQQSQPSEASESKSLSRNSSIVVASQQSAETNSTKRSFREAKDVASRVANFQQSIQETSVKSVTLVTDSQRSVRSSSFRVAAADSSAGVTERSVTGTQWNAESKVSPPVMTSSSIQMSSHDVSPRPAVCAKPTAEAISAALCANASARAAVSTSFRFT
jgi:hypothetical protein